MGETAWPPKPTLGRKARPPRALARCGSIVTKYVSGCCSIAPADDDQPKIRFHEWKSTSNHWLPTNEGESSECMCRRVGHPHMSLKVEGIGS